jgi:hypothetical protein
LKKDKELVEKLRAKNKLENEHEVEPQEMLVSTDGTQLSSLQGLTSGNETEDYDRLNQENKELKEALLQSDTESFSTADKILEKEIEIRIPRERFDELHRVMDECERFCYVIFDSKNTIFLRAKSDRSKIKDIVTV